MVAIADNKGKLRKYVIVLFALYIFVVLWLTLIDRESGNRRAMLVPFWELANVLRGQERWFYAGQIMGNLALFMPFGFMVRMIWKVNWKRILLMSICFSVGIELTQYISGRGLMEFDDVFHNTVGAVLGLKIYKVLRERI